MSLLCTLHDFGYVVNDPGLVAKLWTYQRLCDEYLLLIGAVLYLNTAVSPIGPHTSPGYFPAFFPYATIV